jgi:hypothetical protein
MDTVLASSYVQAHTYAYSRLEYILYDARSTLVYIYIYYNVIMYLYLLGSTIEIAHVRARAGTCCALCTYSCKT